MPTTELSVSGSQPEPRGALADLRTHAMNASMEDMQQGLIQYQEKRASFRGWLSEQLVEGVHYGIVPGTETKVDENGQVLKWDAKANSGIGMWVMAGHHISQWRPKPSFYQAGADFVCDLLGIRCEYSADMDAHQQLGSPKDVFVYICRLFNQAGKLMGEGRGAKRIGDKYATINTAIKIAQKSAKVAAVLDTFGLRDLFTQDLEDLQQPSVPNDNPENDGSQPIVAERAVRLTPTVAKAEMKRLAADWRSLRTDVEGSVENWRKFVTQAAGRPFDNDWTTTDLKRVGEAIEREMGLS